MLQNSKCFSHVWVCLHIQFVTQTYIMEHYSDINLDSAVVLLHGKWKYLLFFSQTGSELQLPALLLIHS